MANLSGQFLQSAAVGAASSDPVTFIEAALASRNAAIAGYVPHLARLTANRQDATLASRFVAALSTAPASADAFKRAALDAFNAALRNDVAPVWNPAVETALKIPSRFGHHGWVRSAARGPMGCGWQTRSRRETRHRRAEAQLGDKSLSDDTRGQIAANLVGVRKLEASIIPAVTTLLGGEAGSVLQRRVIEVLGANSDTASAVVTKFSGLPAELIEPAFAQILKRVDTSLRFHRSDRHQKRLISPASDLPVSIVSEPIQIWRWPNEPDRSSMS